VRIIDKGLKRVLRLLQGTSRYFCGACKTTWRLNKPKSVTHTQRKRNLLPFHEENNCKIIRFPDDNWQKNVEDLRKTAAHLLEGGCRRMLLDLSVSRSINSASFGSVLKVYKLCEGSGCEFRIGRLSADLRDAFRMTSLSFLLVEQE